jgi:glycosyltransferase involved in cell wall biosynthesis
VCVVVPTRDRWPLVDRAVRGALGQEGVAVRVVVVDDGSSPRVPVAGALADPRVTVVRRDRSSGVASARNAGIARAREPWTAVLDDDDLWSPAKLAAQLAACAATGRRWSYTAAVRVDAGLHPSDVVRAPGADEVAAMMLHANVVPAGASTVIVDTALLRAVGGFDEAFAQLADWDLWLRLLEVASPAPVDEPLVAYTQHAQGMAVVDPAGILREFQALQARHRALADALGDRFTPDELLAWTGHRLLDAGRRGRFATMVLGAAVQQRRPGLLVRGVGVLRERRRWRAMAPVAAPAWLSGAARQDPGERGAEALGRVHADVDAPDQ